MTVGETLHKTKTDSVAQLDLEKYQRDISMRYLLPRVLDMRTNVDSVSNNTDVVFVLHRMNEDWTYHTENRKFEDVMKYMNYICLLYSLCL